MNDDHGFHGWQEGDISTGFLLPTGERLHAVFHIQQTEASIQTDDNGTPSGVVLARGTGRLDLSPVYPYCVLLLRNRDSFRIVLSEVVKGK